MASLLNKIYNLPCRTSQSAVNLRWNDLLLDSDFSLALIDDVLVLMLLAGYSELSICSSLRISLNFCHLNIASIRSKAAALTNFLVEQQIGH